MCIAGGWKQSPIFLIVGVGLWYGYAKGCALDWCDTRLAMPFCFYFKAWRLESP